MIADVVLDGLLGELGAVFGHDEGTEPGAEVLVLHADRGRLDDVGVSADEVLDLGRKDVLAAGDDHLVVAATDVEQTVAVQTTDITG